jgi:hypothetical protein
MAIMIVHQGSDWNEDLYEQTMDRVIPDPSNPPDGLIAHSARFEGDTFKALDLWESSDAFLAFAESRLGPAIGKVLGDDAPDGPPEPKFTELHNAYSV